LETEIEKKGRRIKEKKTHIWRNECLGDRKQIEKPNPLLWFELGLPGRRKKDVWLRALASFWVIG
jgi:hypothetical protein